MTNLKPQEEKPIKKSVTPEGYYSEKEMSEFLGKTIQALRSDHCHGKHKVPPKTKLGRVIIYSKGSFEEWLKSREVKPFDYKSRWKNKFQN